jgi:DNA-binding response OmpR family regulator
MGSMTANPRDEKKKVVVVEDDADFLLLLHMILGGEGAAAPELIDVDTGTGAIEAIRRHQPDLVILDLMLPDMNGWEVFMAMRQDANTAETPVIILSSEGTRHDRSFGLQVAQVHDYLVKPCLPSRLRRSVAAALDRPSVA